MTTPSQGQGGSPLPDSVYEASLDCVHCGLCLTSCPTYRVSGRESSSPRGRIYLMRGVAEGRIGLAGALSEEAHLCLGCRNCETACPSGVRYGEMLEQTRHAIAEAGTREGQGPRIERALLRGLVAQPLRLRVAMTLLRAVQQLGLDRFGVALLARIPGLGAFAQKLSELRELAPSVPPAASRAPLPAFTPAQGERRGAVALLEGCVMPQLFGDVNRATVAVLARNGYDVHVPAEQRCCGALHAHAGDLDFARELGRANGRAFADARFDAIVINSAGCGAAMRELDHWLPDDASRGVASRVRDVCEFLDEVGLRAPEREVAARVCYDDPCHLVHAQQVAAAPRRLLGAIPGVELVEHADAQACCGAAGTYNLTQPEMSAAVLDRKMASLSAADPDVIATGNPGCLMQIEGGARAAGLRAEVVHPVELLARSYGVA